MLYSPEKFPAGGPNHSRRHRHRHRGGGIEGQQVAIVRWTAANFRQKLRVLEILIFASKISQNEGFSALNLVFRDENRLNG